MNANGLPWPIPTSVLHFKSGVNQFVRLVFCLLPLEIWAILEGISGDFYGENFLSLLRQFTMILTAWSSTFAVFGDETIRPLGTSSVSAPTTPTLYSMAGGLKLSAASPGGQPNLYVQNPLLSGSANAGGFSGQIPLNSPMGPAPPPVAVPSVPSTPITAHSNAYAVCKTPMLLMWTRAM